MFRKLLDRIPRNDKPPVFLAIAMAISWLIFITLALLLTSCTFTPYWDDGVPMTEDPFVPTDPSPIPVPIPSGWQEYTVVGTVNIRNQPSASSKSMGVLYAGAVVPANCAREDGWCEVTGGYVRAACLGVGKGKCQAK